jgi:hypothetical protein
MRPETGRRELMLIRESAMLARFHYWPVPGRAGFPVVTGEKMLHRFFGCASFWRSAAPY